MSAVRVAKCPLANAREERKPAECTFAETLSGTTAEAAQFHRNSENGVSDPPGTLAAAVG